LSSILYTTPIYGIAQKYYVAKARGRSTDRRIAITAAMLAPRALLAVMAVM